MDDAETFHVFDAHCDTAQRLCGDDPFDLGQESLTGHVDIPRMRRGGVSAQVFACWVDPDTPETAWSEMTLGAVDAVISQVSLHGDDLAVVSSRGDLGRIRSSGKIAVVVGVEGGHVLGDAPERLVELHRAGVRCLTLTWNNTNSLADACDGERRWNGLSPAGRSAVRMMNELGMMIDLSHASDETFYDVLEESASPVIASHSNMRALCDIPRNISDEMLSALGEAGGAVGINFFPAFLDADCHDAVFAVWDRYRAERSELAAKYGGDARRADGEMMGKYLSMLEDIPMPGIGRVADHIEHAASVAGARAVGLGSDFDGIAVVPEGLEDVSRMQALAKELLRRGWNAEDVSAVMGENLLGIFDRVLALR